MAFWQRFAAAEIPPSRADAVLQAVLSKPDPEDSLQRSPLLTDAERLRAKSADPKVLAALPLDQAGVLTGSLLPQRFSEDENSPRALFFWGDPAALGQPSIGIVGTRGASAYGKAVSERFASGLARAGVSVVSGGALGIDAAAHRGAMDAGGKTVAVLLTGIERTYPAVHAGLFAQIRGQGCLISQFAPGTEGSRDFRPLLRNRTIAALCQAIVVIEAPLRSGSMSTANHAAELGRPIYVVPATVDMESFKGSHALIRDGATLVESPEQLLDDLGMEAPSQAHVTTPLSDIQSRILDALDVHPLVPEFIVERTGLDAAEVMSELTMLELDGKVLRHGAGFAKRP